MRRVLIIGLDGATWDLIKPWADKGELPTFKRLMENGVWGILVSTIPPLTIPAWISMMTGKNPGKIGYVHFFMRARDSYEFKFVRPKVEHLNPVWKLLKLGANKTSFILKIPTIPRDSYMDVYLKGEFVFENVEMTENEKKLLEMVKEDGNPPPRHNEEYILWYANQVKKELELIRHLVENDREYQWDLLTYIIYSTDHLSHLFWKFIDKEHPNYVENKNIQKAIMEFYFTIDLELGKIVKLCEEKDILLFIVSDHGQGPLRKRFNLNKWLIENGYMVVLKPASKDRNMQMLLQKLARNIGTYRPFYKLYQRLPKGVKERILKKLQPQLNVKTENIDWKRTKAYFSGYNGININLKKREPEGIVDEDEYEKSDI